MLALLHQSHAVHMQVLCCSTVNTRQPSGAAKHLHCSSLLVGGMCWYAYALLQLHVGVGRLWPRGIQCLVAADSGTEYDTTSRVLDARSAVIITMRPVDAQLRPAAAAYATVVLHVCQNMHECPPVVHTKPGDTGQPAVACSRMQSLQGE
jgi:hypothetical protein